MGIGERREDPDDRCEVVGDKLEEDWGGSAMKGTMVGVVTRGPTSAGGTLVNRALVSVMA